MEHIIGTDLHLQAGSSKLIEHQNMAQYSKSVYREVFAFSMAMNSLYLSMTAFCKLDIFVSLQAV